jgi:hypothetical protein
MALNRLISDCPGRSCPSAGRRATALTGREPGRRPAAFPPSDQCIPCAPISPKMERTSTISTTGLRSPGQVPKPRSFRNDLAGHAHRNPKQPSDALWRPGSLLVNPKHAPFSSLFPGGGWGGGAIAGAVSDCYALPVYRDADAAQGSVAGRVGGVIAEGILAPQFPGDL